VIRVLLVDDDALVRAGIRLMLFSASGIEVVGEAADGTEVLGALDRHHPDVILLDLRMPRLDGLAVLDLLRTQPSPPAVVVLTTFDTDEAVLRALRRSATYDALPRPSAAVASSSSRSRPSARRQARPRQSRRVSSRRASALRTAAYARSSTRLLSSWGSCVRS